MRVEDTDAELLIGAAALVGMVLFVVAGHISDKIGRKLPIVVGYALTLLLLFPLYHAIGDAANPGLAAAAARAPVVAAGPDCHYDPFASEQATNCGKLLGDLAGMGVAYRLEKAPVLALSVGGTVLPVAQYAWKDKAKRAGQLQGWLAPAGYTLAKVTPDFGGALRILLPLFGLMALSAATYGPVAALLTEMFPPRIRYSSMSIPYHFGTGYFGGFLPLIASYIVARTGDPYAGLWYTWGVVLVALVVALFGLKGGVPRDFEAD